MADTQTPQTGIKNADDLIKLADAFGLAVTVETTDRDNLTSYVVGFAIPVPVAYAGTELGRAIAGDTVTLLWTKANRKGARGRLDDATVWSTVSRRKLRTLRHVTAAVERLGHDSKKYARDAAPLPEDVVDAPHAVFVDGRQVHAGIRAAHVRKIVTNQRFRGRTFHQDAEGAICIEDRRYVPVQPASVEKTPAEGIATFTARPAAEVLAADPIPAGTSVLEGMPGREITREELRTPAGVLAHTDYVVQLRDAGRWILPNHDDQADITRGGVAMVQRRMLDNGHGRARTTLDTDGTVYVSDGRQAARYIPAALIADYSADFCPGCGTPYATNGDGPCTGGRSTGVSPRDLMDLTQRLTTEGAAAPSTLRPELSDAADDVEEAWEALRTAHTPTARDIAHRKANAAVGRARAALLAVEQHAAEADRIRTEAAREAYAFGVRLEAQQLATNQVIEERARAVMAETMCTEATEGVRGFVFTTTHLAVSLRAVDAEGNDWPLLTETYGLQLEHAGWFAEPAQGHGLRITPPGAQAADIVAEGRRRSVAAAHDQALAEHAQR